MSVDLYPWFAITTSLGILAFAVLHVIDTQRGYRRYHDDRAAVDVLMALMWLVAAIGLLISASATFVDAAGVGGRAEIRNVGLGLMRGAMLVGAAVLFIVDRRERRRVSK